MVQWRLPKRVLRGKRRRRVGSPPMYTSDPGRPCQSSSSVPAKPITVQRPASRPPLLKAKGINEFVSIASIPPAATAAAPAPVAPLKFSPIRNPPSAVIAHTRTTAPHIEAVFHIDHPVAASDEEGARAWGTFETHTAATKAMLMGSPVVTAIPKMSDSGTPSTMAPTTIPRGLSGSSPPKRASTARSARMKITAPATISAALASVARSAASGIRSNATALMSAPAPNPANPPMTLVLKLTP